MLRICLLLILLPSLVTCGPTIKAQTVIIVRHAEKITSGDKDPDLSEAGKARAVRLAQILEKEKIGRIFSTDFKRTRDTVEPIAKMRDLQIERYNNLEQLMATIKKSEGSILVTGHSNTVPKIVELLSGEKQSEIEDSDFGNLLIVSLVGNASQVIHLRY